MHLEMSQGFSGLHRIAAIHQPRLLQFRNGLYLSLRILPEPPDRGLNSLLQPAEPQVNPIKAKDLSLIHIPSPRD